MRKIFAFFPALFGLYGLIAVLIGFFFKKIPNFHLDSALFYVFKSQVSDIKQFNAFFKAIFHHGGDHTFFTNNTNNVNGHAMPYAVFIFSGFIAILVAIVLTLLFITYLLGHRGAIKTIELVALKSPDAFKGNKLESLQKAKGWLHFKKKDHSQKNSTPGSNLKNKLFKKFQFRKGEKKDIVNSSSNSNIKKSFFGKFTKFKKNKQNSTTSA